MPYKDKQKLYAAQKRYRKRKKRESQKRMELVDEIEKAVTLPQILDVTGKTLDEGTKRLKKLMDEVEKGRLSKDYSKLEELKKEVKKQTEILQITRALNHVISIIMEMKQLEKINQLEKVKAYV